MTRVVVSYRRLGDPSLGEQEAVERELAGLSVVDRMPGAILVEGTEQEVRSLLAGRGSDWSVSEVRELHSPAPNLKTRSIADKGPR